ncbi:hypothetical protein LTR62_002312 [Meristemomyces frigidus]|uniref:Grh/CP2 DB domain-containing protein n=1 Tax=Meristemomyces frigidus TaxID=1508187 RepID=A0AAN7YHQ0_9PEZI|nr:hypothetical protein LTR62_002312 [Meristemomyces frigidus]
MFRNRQSRKPSDDLYKHFKANFPGLGQSVTGADVSSQAALVDALDGPLDSRPMDAPAHDIKDADLIPRGAHHEAWSFGGSGLTPSIMDPDSHHFNMFANQMPGYYTPTPGGTGTLFHSQAGDLHTPGFVMNGLGTPLSMPTSEGGLHPGPQAHTFHNFHAHVPQHVQAQHFHNIDPFHMQHQPAFPPHHFTHHPSFEGMEGPIGESPLDDLAVETHLQPAHHTPEMMFQPHSMQKAMQPPPLHPTGDKFRFHATLNAPTAMIKHANEIPVTYLNKGQAYTLNIVDTRNPTPSSSARYRTFVRVSFEDEQQRLKPAACWQLWKEGRGTNEAHQRGGRLQAVEYVESGQFGSAEDPSKPRVEVESASYDGFCVLWSPPEGSAECPISVRFNFLSTDFSHSKGVKGIPVRLCAKTELLDDGLQAAPLSANGEVCYCKVKLFRDHGAERKLSNDVAHVKKTIDKLNQQISQIESGMKDLGKRKRGSVARPSSEDRPGKVAKHRRTWSMSSVTSNGGRGSAEEDLHMKLMTLQDMFTSTRPASVLYLRGDDLDDPDLNPVKLTAEMASTVPTTLVKNDSTDSALWDGQSGLSVLQSASASPTSSLKSISGSPRDSTLQQPTPFAGPSRVNSSEWRSNPQTAVEDIVPAVPQRVASPQEAPLINVQIGSAATTFNWVNAVGVDATYQPPPERAVKPVACFYAKLRVADQSPDNDFYRAIYLGKRSIKDFNNALALKSNVEPTKILRTIRINRQGLHVLFDDECVRELPEGQDMTAEFCEIEPDSPSRIRREWDAGPTDVQCDGDVATVQATSTTGFELRLHY